MDRESKRNIQVREISRLVSDIYWATGKPSANTLEDIIRRELTGITRARALQWLTWNPEYPFFE